MSEPYVRISWCQAAAFLSVISVLDVRSENACCAGPVICCDDGLVFIANTAPVDPVYRLTSSLHV